MEPGAPARGRKDTFSSAQRSRRGSTVLSYSTGTVQYSRNRGTADGIPGIGRSLKRLDAGCGMRDEGCGMWDPGSCFFERWAERGGREEERRREKRHSPPFCFVTIPWLKTRALRSNFHAFEVFSLCAAELDCPQLVILRGAGEQGG